MDGRPTWTDCDEAGDYVVPNVLSPRDIIFRPDNMDETVPHTYYERIMVKSDNVFLCKYLFISSSLAQNLIWKVIFFLLILVPALSIGPLFPKVQCQFEGL